MVKEKESHPTAMRAAMPGRMKEIPSFLPSPPPLPPPTEVIPPSFPLPSVPFSFSLYPSSMEKRRGKERGGNKEGKKTGHDVIRHRERIGNSFRNFFVFFCSLKILMQCLPFADCLPRQWKYYQGQHVDGMEKSFISFFHHLSLSSRGEAAEDRPGTRDGGGAERKIPK